MRSARLDRRVRTEGRLLLRDARTALARTANDKLAASATALERALADHDLAQVRRQLAAIDDALDGPPRKSTFRDSLESMGMAVLFMLAIRAFLVEAFEIPSSSMYPTLEIGDRLFVNKLVYGPRIPWTTTRLFHLRGPARGEVIVFIYPCDPSRDYIKRVVATAGQTVEVRCGNLYVDGVAVPNHLVAPDCEYNDLKEDTGEWQLERCSRYTETVGDFTYDTFQEPSLPLHPGPDHHDFPRRGNPFLPACNQVNGDPLGAVVETVPEASAKPCEPQLHYVVPEGHVFAMGDNRGNSNDSRVWGSVPIENVKGKALFEFFSHSSPDGIRWSRIGMFVH